MDRQTVATAVVDALARETGIATVYLFGSHAANRAHRESDVDVALLLDPAAYPAVADRFDARLRLSSILIGRLGRRDVDVVILNDAPPTLGRAIVNSGIRLIAGDPARTHAFERDVMLRAADLEPFLRWTRAIKLDALRR